MLQEMKNKLIENTNKTKENGELTAQQVYNIACEGVIQAASKLNEKATDLHAITKEAVTISVQGLVEAEETSLDKISAALHGTVDGIKHVETSVLNTIHNELTRVNTRLNEEEERLAG